MNSRLLEAIESDDLEAVITLLRNQEHNKHYDVNEGLCMAARNGQYDIVQELFQSQHRQPSVQYIDQNQKRALEYAVISGNIDIVRFLLKAGSFVNWSDENGFQPLHFAAQTGNVTMINFLIEKGAHVYSARTNKEGLTPFHVAVDHGHFDAVLAFIESRTVSVNMKTKLRQGGQTPLHRAVLKSHLKIIELLINQGARLALKPKILKADKPFITLRKQMILTFLSTSLDLVHTLTSLKTVDDELFTTQYIITKRKTLKSFLNMGLI